MGQIKAFRDRPEWHWPLDYASGPVPNGTSLSHSVTDLPSAQRTLSTSNSQQGISNSQVCERERMASLLAIPFSCLAYLFVGDSFSRHLRNRPCRAFENHGKFLHKVLQINANRGPTTGSPGRAKEGIEGIGTDPMRVVATDDHMVDRSRILHPQDSRHAS